MLVLPHTHLKTMKHKAIPLNYVEEGHFNALKLSIFTSHFNTLWHINRFAKSRIWWEVYHLMHQRLYFMKIISQTNSAFGKAIYDRECIENASWKSIVVTHWNVLLPRNSGGLPWDSSFLDLYIVILTTNILMA